MSRAEHFSRPVASLDRWNNSLLARGFGAPTGRSLPLGVRLVGAAAVILLASSLWGITVILRHPDIGIGS